MSKIILTIFLLICTSISPLFAADQQNKLNDFKEDFVEELKPIILQENKIIIEERRFVENFFKNYSDNSNTQIDKGTFNKLTFIAKKYQISDIFNKDEYLLKIDEIPVTLALSQAVLESGWGQSSVAKKSQNYFGQRKFTSQKDLDALNYAKFKSLSMATKEYMLNLNTHEAYEEFRQNRAAFTLSGKKMHGRAAARTIKKYSEDAREYTKMLFEIINTHFAKLDKKQKSIQNIRTILLG